MTGKFGAVAVKLAEARFFLELLDVLESRNASLSNEATCGEEASYLLSAVLNALYSALEQAKPILGVDVMKTYKDTQSTIFKGRGGLRNVTVHERHIGPDHAGYIPPPGNAVNFDFRSTPKLIKETKAALPPGQVNFALGPNHYVEIDGVLRDITELCFEQYYALRKFFKDGGIVT